MLYAQLFIQEVRAKSGSFKFRKELYQIKFREWDSDKPIDRIQANTGFMVHTALTEHKRSKWEAIPYDRYKQNSNLESNARANAGEKQTDNSINKILYLLEFPGYNCSEN